MLSYLKKFVMDILPSVAATIIGAYIVNHYIVAKPEAPAAAAVTAAVDPKADPKAAAKPAAVVSSLPEAGVKAKGMSERTLIERSASEKATVTEKPAEKSADPKSADAKPDAPADTASIPADTRHHPAAPKAVAKVTPAAPQPAAPAASAAPVETAVTPEESRDANDLARAAIERLRKERPQEAARSQDATRTDLARLPEAQRPAATSAIRPLPPPIMVSSPSTDNVDQSSQPRPPYAAGGQDSNRLTPPADIPVPVVQAPLDLRAEAIMPAQKNERTSVTDDMFSGMKSMFHAVLPK
ncbi:hypothetical protein ABIF38_003145 [Bradyrhizobium japonicum]|uniref:Extensin n=1 Tax=Bradyrhizobium elkanii TaxID=29448 RepID=A0ABV4FD15_BRAEL|nr:hypothetical protein [Bradyrhizobium elkanii]MBP2432138.1 hypothetical protein [Bradyrhizobium elkanii]MCP1734539.1 hypothetical protein [Bradyrhizobium elkanii]MCP1752333.1 hypothetical protein [Bradyrhizobium elkanii]MCP1978106.1 hypothetical protein [Bradyrhizobium elkanii]MCS3569877.1 hypothetical protein [Bradyrhizobium elkanii]